jgi:UDP-glucose 4-epimerase
MRLLITGATGHIGSHLLGNLPDLSFIDEIIIIDSMLANRYCSLFNLSLGCSFKFLDIDLASVDPADIPVTDITIHLAAKTDAAQSKKFEAEFEKNNFEATKTIVNYAQLSGSKLIFASTTSVYGPQSNTVDENCLNSDLNPQSPYAFTKLREEKMIMKTLGETKNSYLILRLGTVYGYAPGIRFHTAVNKFCFQAATGQHLTVWRTALDQVRPYLSLVDFHRAIEHIIQKNIFDNQVYNIISHNSTVRDIISAIEDAGCRTDVSFVDHEIMNQLSYHVLNTKFIDTKFSFIGELGEGVVDTLSHLVNLSSNNKVHTK